MKLSFATGNIHKVSEANVVGADYGVEFVRIECRYPEVRDPSVAVVAKEGAKYVYGKVGGPVVVEDTGLYVSALSGFPGSYSKFVIEHIGNDGVLKLLEDAGDRSAEFRSAIGYADERGVRVFEGVVAGAIATEERGTGGFGYDPIFIPDGHEATFAEDYALKNTLSHRRKAVEAFCRWNAEQQ